MATSRMHREITQCKRVQRHAKSDVLLPPWRSSTVCVPSLLQVCASLALSYGSNCCYSVSRSMLKPSKVLEAKPLTGLWELKDSRGKLLAQEGRKAYEKKWKTGCWQPSNKEDQLISNLTDDCVASRELSGVLSLMAITLLLLSLLAH